MMLEEKLEILVQLVLRARTFFELWWIYEGSQTRPKYLPAMNRYSEFFRFDSHAHQFTYTIYLCQIFEKGHKTLNIRNVIKEAKTRNLDKDYINKAENALKEGISIYEKLVKIRNNLFGHRSASISYTEAFKKASITPNEIRLLTELGLVAINSLRSALGQRTYGFISLAGEDLEKLLGKINQNR